MRKLAFTKMQGCGNDYIYVVADRLRLADPAALARRISDRRFGVGGDGLIMLCPSTTADVRMEMYNADGSRGEMCGNGIRCVARLHYELSSGRKNPIVVDTDCGPKSIVLKIEAGCAVGATVDMGSPILEGREIPVARDGRVIDFPLEAGGREYRITAVSMGNPHCVIFVDDDSVFGLDDAEFARVGRQFENHPFFPRRVNTEFILPLSRDRLKMRVWERGSGETLACGTGACAAQVAAVLTGRADRSATVELRGGNLEIEWRERGPEAGHVFMTGEAIEVFKGEIEVGDAELVAVA
ncbi:MAG TPA: diaminopimelate epimerase [Candidatus Binataceae bacterium]|jgi:diaminopimelate epimerase|nr:diaminopimelate epimerase [Candidatus Binataceae bacterium]